TGRTELLHAAAAQITDRFSSWLWQDDDRAARLTTEFNRVLNSRVQQRYETEHKAWPGLNPSFDPYSYQAEAAVRGLHEESILLDHCVGAGKTLTVSMLVHEKKRLGQVEQPWIVVPNHLLGQWQSEYLEAYPSDRILVAPGTGAS